MNLKKHKGLLAIPPPVTLTTIALLIGVFIVDYLIFAPADVQRFSFAHLVMGEGHGPIFHALSLQTSAVLCGEVWRVLTSMLLHGGLLHLIPNCIMFWVAGSLVERTVGGKRFALAMFVTGVFANICVMRVCHNEFGYGASLFIFGAFGLLAAMWLKKPERMRELTTWPQRVIILLALLSNIAANEPTLVEHGGGFIGGILLAFLYDKEI
ncbi:MAG: rhomboid family intramembrane serine protease [Oscillospiraceae bacterium]|nr:rhomboid family intramembrane serine protease [Oscillospiraceae bacterium]